MKIEGSLKIKANKNGQVVIPRMIRTVKGSPGDRVELCDMDVSRDKGATTCVVGRIPRGPQ